MRERHGEESRCWDDTSARTLSQLQQAYEGAASLHVFAVSPNFNRLQAASAFLSSNTLMSQGSKSLLLVRAMP